MSSAAQIKKQRQRKIGVVVGNKMDKTVVVEVVCRKPHPLYKKIIHVRSKFYVHDKDNACVLGDKVLIEETRPLSRLKHWRLVEILSS